jgi:cell division transport system ATP-binding protein
MIKFKKVTKKFGNGNVAFVDLSFDIESGEMVAVTGPSGSGKTTIMRLLIREYKPSSGKIIFDGKNLKKIKKRQIPQHRRRIGVVFQDYKLIEELNVWENIALPLNIKGKKKADIEHRVTDLLSLVGLEDKALMFPRQLSGGESQRISIARALATGPKIIFADEPTGNLDPKTGTHIIKLLGKINKLGTTVLLATHDSYILNKFDLRQIDLTDQNKNSQQKSKKKSKPTKKAKEKDKDKEPKKTKKQKSDKETKESSKKKNQDQKKKPEEETQKKKSDQKSKGSFLSKIFSLTKPKAKQKKKTNKNKTTKEDDEDKKQHKKQNKQEENQDQDSNSDQSKKD